MNSMMRKELSLKGMNSNNSQMKISNSLDTWFIYTAFELQNKKAASIIEHHLACGAITLRGHNGIVPDV
jgi:hypothetical protein